MTQKTAIRIVDHLTEINRFFCS